MRTRLVFWATLRPKIDSISSPSLSHNTIITILIKSPPPLKLQFHRPAASVIARRAGATQYAEMFDEGEARSRHGIHKRLVGSGEDLDYESYQGVLGRPGLDFPILTGIPNTNFNCRDVGNGYFADLATDCQVSSRTAKDNTLDGIYN